VVLVEFWFPGALVVDRVPPVPNQQPWSLFPAKPHLARQRRTEIDRVVSTFPVLRQVQRPFNSHVQPHLFFDLAGDTRFIAFAGLAPAAGEPLVRVVRATVLVLEQKDLAPAHDRAPTTTFG
jgi:hypothetical protein